MSITDLPTTPEQLDLCVREFLAENFFFEDELGYTESLTEAGVIDSTGVLEVVGWIEDTFSIMVPDEDILPDHLDSIAGIVRYLGTALHG